MYAVVLGKDWHETPRPIPIPTLAESSTSVAHQVGGEGGGRCSREGNCVVRAGTEKLSKIKPIELDR